MSSNLAKESFDVSADDLRTCGWEAVLQTAYRPECYAYCTSFASKAESLSNTGEEKKSRAFRLLAAITSFSLNCDKPTEPFGATMVDYVSGRRTCLPEDLAASDLAALSGIHAEIRDVELRARVGDLLWETSKDFKAAQIAIEAYIESSLALDNGDMRYPFAKRLQRALQLGAKLGWHKPYHEKAIAAVEAAIARHEATEKGFLCAHLMELLHSDEVGNAVQYSTLSERLAQRAETGMLWDIALGYWQAKKAWDVRRKDNAGAKAAGHKIADMYRNKAEAFTKGEHASFMSAAFWMEKAHGALLLMQADAKQIEEAHKLLLDYQKRSMAEMTTIEVRPDRVPGLPEKLEAAANAVEKFVSGRSFEEAILRFVCVTSPTDTDELRKRAESPEGIFTQIFGSSTVRADGQTSDIAPPLSTEDPILREEAVVKQMYRFARTADWNLQVATFIEPARRKILAEHRAKLRDLRFVVENNPFVPAGREGLFLRGLHAGLHGDLVLAMHLLLPQIENSIREIFIASGVITSKMESDKTQDERDLGWLLTRPEMAQYFSTGMAFDLRGLLVERFGLNIRNDLFHGLLDERHISSEGALYVWWLTLRLCCTPILNAQQKQNSP